LLRVVIKNYVFFYDVFKGLSFPTKHNKKQTVTINSYKR